MCHTGAGPCGTLSGFQLVPVTHRLTVADEKMQRLSSVQTESALRFVLGKQTTPTKLMCVIARCCVAQQDDCTE